MTRHRTKLAALLAVLSAVVGVAAGATRKTPADRTPAEIEGYKGWVRVEGRKPRPLELASVGG